MASFSGLPMDVVTLRGVVGAADDERPWANFLPFPAATVIADFFGNARGVLDAGLLTGSVATGGAAGFPGTASPGGRSSSGTSSSDAAAWTAEQYCWALP